jgi:Family of unknown function (DUF6491)
METTMSRLSTAATAWLLLALGGLGTAGCASTGAASQHASAPLPGTDACVFLSTVYDWQVLDSTTMIVYAPLRKDPYLLKLFAPVIDLDFKERVGFEDSAHTGQLCGNGLDYLVVRGDIPQRMPIVAFRKLTVDQAKQLVAASKRPAGAAAANAPAAGQPPPTPPEAGKN